MLVVEIIFDDFQCILDGKNHVFDLKRIFSVRNVYTVYTENKILPQTNVLRERRDYIVDMLLWIMNLFVYLGNKSEEFHAVYNYLKILMQFDAYSRITST